MDPIAVLKALWQHKLFVLPVLLLTAVGALYVYSYAPRSYEALATYAIVNPKIPSAGEIEKNPALGALNTDNPYLRSADSSLITQVITTRLNNASVADQLVQQGLSGDYTVERPSTAFLVELKAVSDNQDVAKDTVQELGTRLEKELRTIQTINGASDEYLFTSLVVSSPDKATEQFSNRLRSLIVVVAAGLLLTFGAVSLARSVGVNRNRAHAEPGPSPANRRASRKQRRADTTKQTPPREPLTELETLAVKDPIATLPKDNKTLHNKSLV